MPCLLDPVMDLVMCLEKAGVDEFRFFLLVFIIPYL